MNRIGCIDKHLDRNSNITKIIIKLPKYRNNVLWTLADAVCAKMLGYQPQIQNVST